MSKLGDGRVLAVWCLGCRCWTFDTFCPTCKYHLRAFMMPEELEKLNAEIAAAVETQAPVIPEPAPTENDPVYQARVQKRIIEGK